MRNEAVRFPFLPQYDFQYSNCRVSKWSHKFSKSIDLYGREEVVSRFFNKIQAKESEENSYKQSVRQKGNVISLHENFIVSQGSFT
jgi:hypothetical protein